MLLCMVFSLQARVYVLSVGVSKSYNANNDLPQASRGAQQFADAMRLQTKDIILLTSKNATASAIRQKLNDIVSRAGKEDRIVFFHEGHGYPGGLCAVDENISYEELAKTLDKSKANLKLVFLGGCHSGSAKNAGILEYGDQAWFTVAREDEYGAEYAGGPIYFGQSVAKGLRGKADFDGDYDVTITELFKYIYNDLRNKQSKAEKSQLQRRVDFHPTLIAPKALHSRVVIRHKKPAAK